MKNARKAALAAVLAGAVLLSGCAASAPMPVPVPGGVEIGDVPSPPTEAPEPPAGMPSPEEPGGEPPDGPRPPELVTDYIGPDGRDHRLTMMEGQSMLYKSCRLADLARRDGGGNVVLSPLSASMAMGMAALGAQGETRRDMESFLGMDADAFADGMAAVIEDGTEGLGTTLEVANGIWTRDDLGPVSDAFGSAASGKYRAAVEPAPMDDSTVEAVNGFASRNTHGMIPVILRDIPDDTACILANAVYMDASWSEEYSPSQVAEGTFRGLSGDSAAEMMSSTERTYMENGKATAFAKYYMGGYRFVGILPKDEGGFELAGLDLDSLLASETRDYDVDAVLPAFEFGSDMDLSRYLEDMGLSLPFTDYADFGGMMADGHLFHIDRVAHAARIEVTREGTKAAAVTAVAGADNAAPMEPRERKSVVLDRPFAFLVLGPSGDVPLFVGIVTDI